MQEVIKIFREIQETSSLNQKKTIIAANKDNKLFKRCLGILSGHQHHNRNCREQNQKVC